MIGTMGTRTRRRRRLGRAAGAVVGSALALGLTASAMANHTSTTPSTPVSDAGVVPVTLSGDGLNPGGNRSCADLAHAGLISGDYTEVKRNYNDGSFESAFPANLNVSVTDGKYVAWNSTHTVKAVIVKGSDAANIYAYNPTLPGDSGLASPTNASGGPSGLSNLTFCYTPAPPKVTVAKIVDGVEDDPTPFSATLSGGGATVPFTGLIETNGASAPQEIVAGTEYTLTEDEPIAANYELKSISCSIGQASGTGWVFTPQAGDVVTCTITNTFTPPPPPPTVTIAKVVEGVDNDPTAFSATLSGGGATVPFTGLIETNGASAPQEIVAGTEYTLTEDQPLAANYALKSISCSIGAASGTGWVFTPQAGDAVTCTITNTYTPPTPPENPPGVTTGTPEKPGVVTAVRNPRLAIVKTAPSRARGLDTIVYTIRVRNPGKAVARNVVVTDPLPVGLTFVRSSRPSSVTGRTVTVKMGNLRPGQARVVKITVRAAANIKGRKVNVATARATNVRPVRDAAPTVFRPLVRRVIPAVTG